MPVLTPAAREVVSTAARAVDAAELRAALVEPLRRLLGVGPMFVASADPVTWLLTGGSSADIGAEASARFLANEYGGPDLLKLTDLAGATVPAQALLSATDRPAESSSRWREVLEPLGWGDELRAALRDRSGVWGYLCLHRTADEPAFSPAEVALLLQVIPALTEAFRRTAVSAAPPATTGEPGVLLIGLDLAVRACTGSADELLDELRATSPGHPLPLSLTALAARVLADGTAQRLTLCTPRGRWVSLHASLLQGTGAPQVAVVVEGPAPHAVLPLFAASIGLTPRETEVAAVLLRGQSTRLAARALQVSEQTLQTQVRAVLGKAQVHSRSELVARLMGHR